MVRGDFCMYQESNNTISWIKVGVRLLLALLILVLSVKLISLIATNNETNKVETNMNSNLEIMMDVATKYFKDDSLPNKAGESNKILLSQLIKEKLIEEIKDEHGNKCSVEESFIKATKLDKEYQIKAYLVCGKNTDYLNKFIPIKESDITVKPITTTTTTKKVTTTSKKVTKTTIKKTTTKKITTIKKYTVTFNSNGGTSTSSQKVKKNGKAIKTVPVREGYTFVGWYYHGEEFDFNTKINQDYILVAKWTKAD